MNNQKKPDGRIIILGIDGATWNIIDRMLEQNRLPNFSRVIKKGIRANLRSLKISASPRVWTSIATGKEAEKHGILNFRNNIQDLKSKRIWDIFQKNGESVTVIYWYLTWPPKKDTNGVMVPGFLARDNRTIPDELSFIKDIELTEKRKVQEGTKIGGFSYYFNAGKRAIQHGVKLNTLFKAISFVLKRKLFKQSELDTFKQSQYLKLYLYKDIFLHLLKKKPTDFTAIMFPQPDQMGHKFWAFMEPKEYFERTGFQINESDVKKYKNSMYDVYDEMDKLVGQVYDQLSPEDCLVVLSDHGFGLVNEPLASLKIKSNDFLRLLNLQKRANGVSIGINYIIQLKDGCNSDDLQKIQSTIENIRTLETNEQLFDVKIKENEIVLEFKRIFSIKLKDAQKILNQKIQIGESVVTATDILVNRLDITGTHEPMGVLMMAGKNIKKNVTISEQSVLDIMPTLLYLRKMAIGNDMDGKIISEAFTDEFLNQNSIQYIDSYENEDEEIPSDLDEDYEMTSDIENKLRELGYLS